MSVRIYWCFAVWHPEKQSDHERKNLDDPRHYWSGNKLLVSCTYVYIESGFGNSVLVYSYGSKCL